MGWRYRKSINLGLGFRINLSKSGIGYSWGVPGFRVTKTANGKSRTTYSIPGTGISYVEQNNNSKNTNDESGLYTGETQEFENIPIEDINKNDPILNKINKARKLNKLSNIFISLTILTFYDINALLFLVIGVILKIIIITIMEIELHYEFDEESRKTYNSIKEVLILLSNSKKIWQVNSSTRVFNTKYNAGAGQNITRTNAFVTNRFPWYINTNIEVFGLNLKKQKILFTPDRVIVFKRFGKAYGCPYNDMFLGISSTRFIESERVYNDSEVIDYAWKYTNLDGSRDLRFTNNKRFPICKYGELTIQSPSGINTIINFSNYNLSTDIQNNLVQFGKGFNGYLQNRMSKLDKMNEKQSDLNNINKEDLTC